MFDVVCVGGSVAGSATAALLARRGRRVLIAERARFPREKACGEGLLPPGVEVLERMGVQVPEAVPTRGLLFRVGGTEARIPFPHTPGWGVRRYHLDAALLAHAREAGAEVRTATVREVAPGRIRTETGEIRARVVVGADGVHSLFPRDLGIGVHVDPTRVGFSTHLRGFVPVPDLVEVICRGGSEIYLAPVGDGLTLAAVLASRSLDLTPPRIEPFLRDALGDRMAGVSLQGPVLGAAPLTRRVERIAGRRWLLVGDSAGAVDPVSGAGMSLALLGAELAAEAIERALTTGNLELRSYSEHFRPVQRSFARLAGLLLGLASRPRLARRVIARGAGFEPLMDVATARRDFSWPRVARSLLVPARS
jgi:flavin-dependent dehydrogenase